MSHIRCKWIPGTFDGVRVVTGDHAFNVDLQKVQEYLGETAVQNLYLKGLSQHDVPDETVVRLAETSGPQFREVPV